MKLIFKCSECGEELNVSATEVTPEGIPVLHVATHECFSETETVTCEPTKRPWDAWPPPAREITPDGLAGIAPNTCMLCDTEAIHTGRNSFGEDLFSCPAGNCGIEFKETGTGPELLPSSFEEEVEYEFYCGDGTRFRFVVREVDGGELKIEVFGGFGSIFFSNIFVNTNGESEFFTVPESVSGTGDRVYPYCRKS